MRSNEKGEFQTNVYMPVTGEGARNVTAYDETGNVGTASFFTEFGFDSIARELEDIRGDSGVGAATPVANPGGGRTRFRKVSPRRRGRAAGGPAMTKKHLPYADVAAGGISRRRLMQGAAGLGLAASVRDVGSHAALARAAAQEAGGPGPAADRLIFSSFNVDQAPVEITQNKMDLYLYGLKAAGARSSPAPRVCASSRRRRRPFP